VRPATVVQTHDQMIIQIIHAIHATFCQRCQLVNPVIAISNILVHNSSITFQELEAAAKEHGQLAAVVKHLKLAP